MGKSQNPVIDEDRQFVVYLTSRERKDLWARLIREAEHEKRSIQQQLWRVLEERYKIS